ncbi:MAG: 4Fe-4S binding protein [Anaerolineales bacterium]|nr:4Fe-4S binding protein [Chloroflexota bacterium]MBL6980118.1 4Fe-4S binding protein [Anaerolineales bacterium]
MITEIRDKVAEQLEKLDGIVALRSTEDGAAPYLFQQGDNLEELVMNPRYPLSKTASKLQKRFKDAKLGVVARGCDVRALVEMAKRNQIDPDRLVVIGVTCTSEEAEFCFCAEPAPNLDQWSGSTLIGEPVPGAPPNPIVAEYAQIPYAERWAFWKAQFTKCHKCFGCRDICPVCFCEACALEDPLWVEPGLLAPDFPMYHLIKAQHMTTRCVGCRQCEMACPADIPLTVLYDLVRQDVAELIGYVPGADINEMPPFTLTLADAAIESDLVY